MASFRGNSCNSWILFFLCFCNVLPASAALQAGAAKGSITPDVAAHKVPLGGYAARRAAAATGVHDPVFARALVLSEGRVKVGIVSVDLCFLPANVKAEVVARVAAAGMTGLDSGHLLIAATHTHTAPDPLAMHSGNTFTTLKGWPQFDRTLLDFTAQKIADTVVEADRKRAGARILVRSRAEDAPKLNRNRRGGPTVDTEMTVLKVLAKDGRPLAEIFNFAAHPTLYDGRMLDISADWPGAATQREEARLGSGSVCLFLNGAEGDATVAGADGKTPDERVATFGAKISAAIADMENSRPVRGRHDKVLRIWTQAVTLPERVPSGMFVVAAAQMGASFQQAQDLVTGLMPTKTTLTFIQIGPLLLMGFPCEPTGDVGLAAKAAARKAGFARPAVVALANDWLAYCVTPAQYKAAQYEASMSFYGPNIGPAMLQGVANGLKGRP